MVESVKVGAAGSIAPGSGKAVQAGGKLIAVFNVEGKYYAIDHTCKHRGGPLGEGELEGNVVTCPWHGWQYDVTTGAACMNPAVKLACYPVQVQGSDLYVTV